jgi:hypothetical protein
MPTGSRQSAPANDPLRVRADPPMTPRGRQSAPANDPRRLCATDL